jgi:hypothetical protein
MLIFALPMGDDWSGAAFYLMPAGRPGWTGAICGALIGRIERDFDVLRASSFVVE